MTAENNELWNQVNRVATLIVVVLMLVGWMFRDVLEHTEIRKELEKQSAKIDRIESVLSKLKNREAVDEKRSRDDIGNGTSSR